MQVHKHPCFEMSRCSASLIFHLSRFHLHILWRRLLLQLDRFIARVKICMVVCSVFNADVRLCVFCTYVYVRLGGHFVGSYGEYLCRAFSHAYQSAYVARGVVMHVPSFPQERPPVSPVQEARTMHLQVSLRLARGWKPVLLVRQDLKERNVTRRVWDAHKVRLTFTCSLQAPLHAPPVPADHTTPPLVCACGVSWGWWSERCSKIV